MSPDRQVFEYALLRAVPRVDRGECVNIGVVLYCRGADFLRTAVEVDDARVRALDPSVDLAGLHGAADAVRRTCAGDGPAGATSLGQRFRWLTAPRSTVVQAGPVHGGLTADPEADLARLLAALVRTPA
ncbi:MAG: hypothetical protein JWM64_2774 [Frankiales bacterium]|nr:hypothetical protein [Frankiales bacterium]